MGSGQPKSKSTSIAIWRIAIWSFVVIFGIAAIGWSIFHGVRSEAPHNTASPNAYATPLVDGQTIGSTILPPGDSRFGGHGEAIVGIRCDTMEQAAFHIHAHLAIFLHGRQIAVPAYVGIVSNGEPPCIYWLHTHDAAGIIHIEAPALRAFTLRDFFAVWGQPLSAHRVGPYSGRVRAYVGSLHYRSDPRSISLTAHEEITLEVGRPYVSPPKYTFPSDD